MFISLKNGERLSRGGPGKIWAHYQEGSWSLGNRLAVGAYGKSARGDFKISVTVGLAHVLSEIMFIHPVATYPLVN